MTYGVGGSVDGLGIQTETSHSTLTEQSADTRGFTSAKRYDVLTNATDGYHWVWGYDGNLGSSPKTYYLY